MKRHVVAMFVLLALLGAGCVTRVIVEPGEDGRDASDVNSGTRLDLSGQGLTQVSQDVFTRTDLVELDLSNNRLGGAIPAEIRQLSQLEVLDLSDNLMTGLPAEIGQLRHLKVLNLSNNQLTGLPLELGQLVDLETLDLRGNVVSIQDLDSIREDLRHTQILVDD